MPSDVVTKLINASGGRKSTAGTGRIPDPNDVCFRELLREDERRVHSWAPDPEKGLLERVSAGSCVASPLEAAGHPPCALGTRGGRADGVAQCCRISQPTRRHPH